MNFQKCTKCSNDLPFEVSKKEIKCFFCGSLNKIGEPIQKCRSTPRRNKSSSQSGSSSGLFGFLLDSDSDSDSGNSNSGSSDGGVG